MTKTKVNNSVFIAVGLFVFYLTIYWRRLLLDSEIPFDGNTLRLFYPSWVIGKHLLINGFSFLWDPFRNMGQPFLADPQNQALYPLRFLSFFTNYLDYQRIFIVFHVLLSTATGLSLAHHWYKKPIPSLMAGLIFGFNGFLLSRVTLASHFATLAWAPAILYSLCLNRPKLLGLCLSLQWMAGYPPFFIITGFGCLFFLMFQTPHKRTLLCFCFGVLFFLGITALQTIPFLSMLNHSWRPVLLNPTEAIQNSINPLILIKFLFYPSFLLTHISLEPLSDPAMIRFFFSPVTFLLALFGFLKGQKREKILGIMGLFGLILSLGKNLGFYQYIPFITLFRFPSHWILLGGIAMGLLSAYGLNLIKNQKIQLIILIIVAIDLLCFAWPRQSGWCDMTFLSDHSISPHEIQTIPDNERIFHSNSILFQAPSWEINSGQNWFMLKGILLPSMAASFGIHEAMSYSLLTSRRHIEFINRLNQSAVNPTLFNLACVSKIVTLEGNQLASTMPRWDKFRVLENKNKLSRALLLPNIPVPIIKDKPGDIQLHSHLPGVLVLSESYEPGWKAKVDDETIAINPYENKFVSIPVPSGEHQIRFRYCPPFFLMGLWISLFSLLVCLIIKENHGRDVAIPKFFTNS